MDESRLTDELQEIGLTKYESSAYIAAVRLGSAKPTELADASAVPQARIYDVTDDLQERGLVEVQETSDGKTVEAPPPEVVLDQFRQRRIDSFTRRVSSISSSLADLHERERSSEEFVTMVTVEESALRHIRRAIDDAEWWLTIALPTTLYDDVAANVADAVDRGVSVRLLVDGDDERGLQPCSDQVTPEFPDGTSVRHRPTLDTFAFADRTYGIFNSQHPREESQPYVITQESNLVMLFQNYAEQVWTGSEFVQTGDGLPKRYLDPWRAIADLGDDLDGDRTLVAEVHGRKTHTRSPDIWSGRIVDYEMSGPFREAFEAVLPTTAALTVDTDEGELTVGGWKATVEDVAADGLRVYEA